MGYRIWYSTQNLADYIIDYTILAGEVNIEKKKMYESDANNAKNFHSLLDHIKKILYLDAPDLIVEKDLEPIFSIEISTEAGTGHNAFQRFARLAASVENNVPSFYIYPEASIVHRTNSITWDKINPLILQALKKAMDIYQIPALLYYFPSDFNEYQDNPHKSPNLQSKGLKFDQNFLIYSGCPDSTGIDMVDMFNAMNSILQEVSTFGVIDGRNRVIRSHNIVNKVDEMEAIYHARVGDREWSPLTSTIEVPTSKLINYLSNFHTNIYNVGDLLNSRERTIIYCVNAKFRGDPYPGALAAIDYLKTRQGKTFEERYFNLVLAWGKVEETEDSLSIESTKTDQDISTFFTQVESSENRSNILSKSFSELHNHEISRYYMQVRYGSMFSKVKHIRVYSYFADAILFHDGALWRDG
ncbi:MAG: Unknown protein [uncultured Sulfurovum sp.]|uniref:Uncharacterized protein n=1 Tax=uncultured Sulfurovum sp. TaxID=269237 RepID=A0A6S6TRK9_9BACT|nr:MAG: Unknown protein [uncultured Sulfurovum sp.]